ncbi:ExbD/TolR family protein [Erythrobacter litoralis]|uniref:TolR biopolymer transport protein n=1 Tax=Erythrobacter litoralis (strain HTCC2594) TaxID=314225 RepID=Q2N8J5_ERYLH|nr:ExbD/TolR family protein [Erythrobacter litoralis]ABC63996.1 TolR biopolymer transport protein [Erythrobacter litoralis HTCC2594]
MAMGVLTSSRGRNSRRAPMAEINVTPFVDVMLVLLIIFMVTAPLLNSGVPVELPESRANALPNEVEQVTVSMGNDGTIYIDDAPQMPGRFAEGLSAIPARADGSLPDVTLRADRSLDYGRVMAVMGELNRAGFNSISLVTSGSSDQP